MEDTIFLTKSSIRKVCHLQNKSEREIQRQPRKNTNYTVLLLMISKLFVIMDLGEMRKFDPNSNMSKL